MPLEPPEFNSTAHTTTLASWAIPEVIAKRRILGYGLRIPQIGSVDGPHYLKQPSQPPSTIGAPETREYSPLIDTLSTALTYHS